MNFKAPDFSEFGKWCASPTGIVVISLILLVGYATFKKQREGSAPKLTPEASLPQAPQSSFSKVELPNDPFSRPSTPVDNHRSIEVEKRPPVVILPISLYNSLGDDLGEINAPYGRFIKCKLVNTVDSARIDTPIVGLVLEDVLKPGSYGEVIIPAGTEVHGTATIDRSRDRIASQPNWIIVWTDGTGRELNLQGVACEYAPDVDGNGWEITDGSAGIRGDVIKSDNDIEIKLFAAKFLEGFSTGIQESTQTTNFGVTTTQIDGSIKNAIAQGAQQTLNQYAGDILRMVQQDGFFIRVPAGKEFYLYIRKPIDQQKAVVGGSDGAKDNPNKGNL